LRASINRFRPKFSKISCNFSAFIKKINAIHFNHFGGYQICRNGGGIYYLGFGVVFHGRQDILPGKAKEFGVPNGSNIGRPSA
jgi:hypothetical protein